MKLKNLLRVLSCIAFCLVAQNTLAEGLVDEIYLEIDKLEGQIMAWRNESLVVGLMAVLIAIAGGLTSFLSSAESRIAKATTIALGVLVIVLVATKEQFFPNSRPEIKNRIVAVKQVINDAKIDISLNNGELDAETAFLHYKKLVEMSLKYEASTTSDIAFSFLPKAYAERLVCKAAHGENDSCYQGIGRANSRILALVRAQDEALQQILDDFSRYFREEYDATEEELHQLDLDKDIESMVKQLGEPDYFKIGDGQVGVTLTLHIPEYRSHLIKRGTTAYLLQLRREKEFRALLNDASVTNNP